MNRQVSTLLAVLAYSSAVSLARGAAPADARATTESNEAKPTTAAPSSAPAGTPVATPVAAPAPASESAAVTDTATTGSAQAPVESHPQAPAKRPEPENAAPLPAKPAEPAGTAGGLRELSHPSSPRTEDGATADDGVMGSHQLHTYLLGGVRTTWVRDAAFDPFRENDVLSQFTLSVGRVLGADGAGSFGLGAGWDYGAARASARSAKTSLYMHRLTLIPEARYHLLRRLYAFGRVGAGIAFVHAELRDSVANDDLTAKHWVFTVDPSVGLAYELLGEASGGSKRPRVWVLLDGGYLFTAGAALVMQNETGNPARSEARSLGNLGVSGVSARLSASLSF